MALIDMKITEFIAEIDSNKPAPGGGSVSALANAIGCALLRMVGHLTVDKKSFQKLDVQVQADFKSTFSTLKLAQDQLLELVDADTVAFNEVMSAIKLPKTTNEEQTQRDLAMAKAFVNSATVPLNVAKVGLNVLQELAIILEHGNKNAITDAGVAVLLLASGIEGAILNVKVNLASINDQDFVLENQEECIAILNQVAVYKVKYMEIVNKTITF